MLTCNAGHSWQAESYSTLVAGRRSRIGRVLALPRRFFRTVRRHRGMEPVPLTYLMAAAAGVALGVIIDRFSAVRWWLVAAGFVSVVWLFFMSTAFWGPHRMRRRHIAGIVNSAHARSRERAALEKAIRAGELRVYAVATWNGPATLGGWGRGSGGWHGVTLRFIDPADERTWVEVETRAGDGPARHSKELLAENLLSSISDPPTFGDIHQMRAWHVARRRERESLAQSLKWQPGRLRIDGVDVAAELVRFDDGTAAVAVHEGWYLEVLTRQVNPEEVEYIRTPTLQTYLKDMPR